MRPFKQPRVVAEILGGILLGPTAFGNIPGFTANIFPESSMTVLETVSEFGLIFFLFLVGLELDINQIRKSGVKTVWLAAAGITLPFGMGAIVAYIIHNVLEPSASSFGAFALFIGVALSITAFPVLARILTERKLLNTEIGQIAMSAAALNDVVAWVLLALAVAITNSGSSPLVAVWVLLLGIAFVAFMFLVVSPVMHFLAHHNRNIPTSEPVIAITLLLVLGSAFLTDMIGIHVIFGAFICGLIIPKDTRYATILIEKVEDYVTVLFLPLYFAASGLKTKFSSIDSGTAVLILFMVLATACIGKVSATFIVAKSWGVKSRKALALGFLMNTKGLVELIVLNIGLSKGVLDEQTFAILVIMAIVTTFMTTPIVMWLYKEARDLPPYKRRSIGDGKEDLSVLFCPIGSSNIHSMRNMMEILRGKDDKLQAHVLHLMECSDRFSSIQHVVLSRHESHDDSMDKMYAELRKEKVKVDVAISALDTMHIDICNSACSNRVNFLLLPFHMHQGHDHGNFVNKSVGLKEVNLKVLQDTPCSVGVLVDNGRKTRLHDTNQHIHVFFFGGPNDREALMLACRMLQHGDDVKLTVIQFVTADHNMPNRMLTSHVETKLRWWSALKCLGRKVGDFFLAPWTKTAEHDTNEKVDMVNADGEVHVFLDNIMFQKERNMDMQALAAMTTNFKKEEVCNKSNIPFGNVTLKVIEAKNLEMSVLDIVNTIHPNGLIITGMQSPLVERSAFPTLEDHGLGHLGNFLVSKNMQTSLLVVQQYKLSRNDDFGLSNSRPVAEEFERHASDSSAPSDMDASTTSDNSESSRFK